MRIFLRTAGVNVNPFFTDKYPQILFVKLICRCEHTANIYAQIMFFYLIRKYLFVGVNIEKCADFSTRIFIRRSLAERSADKYARRKMGNKGRKIKIVITKDN